MTWFRRILGLPIPPKSEETIFDRMRKIEEAEQRKLREQAQDTLPNLDIPLDSRSGGL